MRILYLLASVLMAVSCTISHPQKSAPKEGIWRGVIALNDSIGLPFNFELTHRDSGFALVISNAGERIETSVSRKGDSLKIQMPVFATYILAKAEGEKMSGFFINPDAQNYRLSFSATFGDSNRFAVDSLNCCDINRKWVVKFAPGTKDEDAAIAYFEQKGTDVSGSIVTETGDYRYLQGVLSGSKLKLSTFDGSNLYVFDANILNGQKIEGLFYSGRSFMEPWIAYRNDTFQLPPADSLTYLKEGYERMYFSFPDANGDTISLDDPRFKDKPMIIQIMGSWCPNCMDESRYLIAMYSQYHDEGLEIVGLSFERVKDRSTAWKRVAKMVEDLQIPYPVLLAGATRKDKAEDMLPMLNHVIAFPTTIYLNRDHSIKKIHTGFTGPGTPLYDSFVAENKITIEEMIHE